jgi:hypothetical protein
VTEDARRIAALEKRCETLESKVRSLELATARANDLILKIGSQANLDRLSDAIGPMLEDGQPTRGKADL